MDSTQTINRHTAPAPAVHDIPLIDWESLRIGGMAAYEQALRALAAAHLELTDRFAQHLAEHGEAAYQRALARISLSDLERRSFAEALQRALTGEES